MIFWRTTQIADYGFEKLMHDRFVGEQIETLNKIIWSDEVYFKLLRHVNRYNGVYRADGNPNITIETQLNQPGVRA